jgi:prophage regulatory protein
MGSNKRSKAPKHEVRSSASSINEPPTSCSVLQHTNLLPQAGFVRLSNIIGKPATKAKPAIPAIIPVSKSTWWAGVGSGRYPQPTRELGPRITAWSVESIRAFIAQLSSKDS